MHSRANRLKGADRVLVTTMKFRAVLLREIHRPTTRALLQRCSIERTFLLVLFCGNGLDPVIFKILPQEFQASASHIVIS
jgi:hypothetical protein